MGVICAYTCPDCGYATGPLRYGQGAMSSLGIYACGGCRELVELPVSHEAPSRSRPIGPRLSDAERAAVHREVHGCPAPALRQATATGWSERCPKCDRPRLAHDDSHSGRWC